ncbi:SpaA isopeptide-forming pilin-related protein [Arthrobacter sp. Y-9]|uniref:DUF6923 family protein n=1 Tax=Arthrobacter sp. Y-9 TaxID=3039385 RepID=UPI00241FE564|nr:SpaA isopeptide-forming pilin-related protein [Arthrobacter sp. Y-9]WFR84291.1 SpaA isopeptide-forming pilin-related protein [Arthrobacter sp. Y-9]
MRALVAVLTIALLGIVPLVSPTKSVAAAGDPFDPTVPMQWQMAGQPSTLYDIVINSDGTISFVAEGTASITYNALAFNPLDGYLYAAATIGGVNKVIKIGQGGVVVNNNVATLPDAVPNITGIQAFIDGAIDPATGTMYLSGNNNNMSTLTKVNLATGAVTTINLSQTLTNSGIADFVYQAGALWTVNAAGSLIKIDPTTGVVTTVKTNVVPAATGTPTAYGGGFSLGNGNFVFIDNGTGKAYQIDISTTAYQSYYMGQAVSSNNNDAASSLGAPTDLVVGKCGPGQGTCTFPTGSNTPLHSYPIGQDPASGYAAGQQFTYTITVFNDGPGLSSGSVVTDTLPAGTTYVSSSNPTCVASGSTVNCASGQLASGASTSYTVTVLVAAGTTTSLTNTAKVLGNEAESDPTDNTDTHTIVPAAASITLAKDVVANSWTDVNNDQLKDAGDTIRYQFVVTNTSNVILNPVTLSDPMLAGAGVAITCPQTSLNPGASMTCTSAPYTITQANVDTNGGLITNTATVTGKPPYSLPNVTATDPATFQTDQKSSISLTKTPNTSSLVAGQTVTYTFVAKNTGTTTLSNVVIAETSFNGLGIAPVVTNCNPAQGSSLAPGATMTCTATYVPTQGDIDAYSTTGKKVDNYARVTATSPNGAVSATAEAHLPSTGAPQLVASKSVSPVAGTMVQPGQVLTYTLTFDNTSGTAVAPVAYTDWLGDVLDASSFVSGSVTSTTTSGTALVVTNNSAATPQTLGITGAVAAGAKSVVTYQVKVNDAAHLADALLENYLTPSTIVTPPTTCPSGSTTCTVNPVGSWTLSKTANPASGTVINPGDPAGSRLITYTVTATNLTANPVSGVVLTDDLSQVLNNATFTSGSASLVINGGSPTAVPNPVGQKLTTSAFTLPANGTAVLTYSVTVNSTAWLVTLTNSVTGNGTVPPQRCVTGGTGPVDPACVVTHPTSGHMFVQKTGPGATAGSTVPLGGAVFEVHADVSGQMSPTATGQVSAVSGSTGLVEVRQLVPGTYWLLETKAPSGYTLLAAPVKFTLSSTGTVTVDASSAGPSVTASNQTITVNDLPAVKLPFAGGPGMVGLIGTSIGGVLLLLLAALLVIRSRREEKTS